MRALTVTLALLAFARYASGQRPDLHRSGLPRQEARRLEAVIDDPATHRFDGDATIATDEVIEGDVFVYRGLLTLRGTVRGQLVVVDGDVVFERGAEVTGDVTVVGGSARGGDNARLAGALTEYGEGFGLLARARDLHEGGDVWRSGRHWEGNHRYADRRQDMGSAGFSLSIDRNYNRVEGLPYRMGPDLRTGGPFATRLAAFAIWRSDVGPLTNTERMGYVARVEQFVGTPALRLGASVRSTIDPMESWTITDLEATLATVVFHEDQRDYYQREGWSGYLRLAPERSPLDLTVEYRDETQRSAAARDPWTVLHTDALWRNQPLAGEGRLRTLNGTAIWDARHGDDFTSRGFYMRADMVHGLSGSLALPAAERETGEPLAARAFDNQFTAGQIDIRRYAPLGWEGALAFRAVAGGSFDQTPLAPQYQHALGGANTLPGYPLMSVDCGARTAPVRLTNGSQTTMFFPSYGCDRFALFQAEYRGGLDFHIGGDEVEHYDRSPHFDASVNWTVFFDAARGWTVGDLTERTSTGTLYDVGAGVILGGFGVYGAVPLTGDSRELRVFLRLGPRF